MTNAIFTICSINYLGQAQTLMRSVRVHEPNSCCYIILVDRKTKILDFNEAKVIWLEDLDLRDIEHKAFIFDVLELNTNIKPSSLKYLLKTHENCIYLDPDTFLYSPLDPIWEGLSDANIVLTPHTISPQLKTHYPWNQDHLRHGGFNLGFIGVKNSSETLRFLDWWEFSCLTSGFNAPADGFYVDQKFIDHAHMFFDGVKVLRHKGLNVAYWNLHERFIAETDGSLWVGTDLLVFMHFSGFIYAPDKKDIEKITKYSNEITLEKRPDLRLIFEGYRSELKISKFESFRDIPYSFSKFDNGVEITQVARRLVGSGVIEIKRDSKTFFLSGGDLYKTLKKIGALQDKGSIKITRNLNIENKQLNIAKRILRATFYVIGLQRYMKLMKFFGFAASTFNLEFLIKNK